MDDQERRVYSDATGMFRLTGLTAGARLLRIQAFGYEALVVPVTAGTASVRIDIVLQPMPLVLEGIEVRGGEAISALSGVVLDAVTGVGIPWSSLWLRGEEHFSTDDRGVFRLSRVTPGAYLLLAERLGYESLYVPVRVTSPPAPVVVRLQPDTVLLEGIRVVNQRLGNRRDAYAFGSVRAYDEERLRRSSAADMQMFLQQHAFLSFHQCTRTSGLCIRNRGRSAEPMIFIDDVYVPCGLDRLRSYRPSELYAIEVFSGGSQIRAYTPVFMSREGRRPGAMIPANLLPPPVAC